MVVRTEIPHDVDAQETGEWLDAMEAVVAVEGLPRAHFLLDRLIDQDRQVKGNYTAPLTTAYVNTVSLDAQPAFPGNVRHELRLDAYLRWNAMALVLRAGKSSGVGGHIATYASATTLYEVGFRHFFRAATPGFKGDMVFIQGHSSPGIYARAFLEGRITEDALNLFRRETRGGPPSYPHPRTSPEFWEFPTVSMGLGPLMAAYQARYTRYLEDRELIPTQGRKVWAFLGDGEQDQPETLAAVAMAGRERLDNLIFVVNCNLQRLDGPVRGNSKIIQELESVYRGAGWNVIKVIWGSEWDELLQADHDGRLHRRMMECVDGEYQVFKARDGAFVREHFFGKDPVLRERVAHLSDEQIGAMTRGGHDPVKVFAAYAAATAHQGQPTVVLAKTVKGYGMGAAGEAANTNHQQKKMNDDAVRAFRDRFGLPILDSQLEEVPFLKPREGSAEDLYFKSGIERAGGFIPHRRLGQETALTVPELAAFSTHLKSSEGRESSTTMAFVRVLAQLLRDPGIGQRIVPIVPDESRTFGMDGMFRQVGIYSHVGQLYTPQDADQFSFYREDRQGQILQEGINESGAMSSWIAAATAHSTHGVATIPFYIYYSMFGFQRIGDLAWAAGDIRARGFLLGATAGRTTLEGEGLQHDDGHSHVLSSVIPSCISYDPAYAYEIAVIVQEGLRRMFQQGEDVFYYLTLMNEKWAHPAMPEGAAAGILKGMHRVRDAEATSATGLRVQLLGSGAILRESLAAAELLEADFGIGADVWSVTSFTELRRDGLEVERWNRLHPLEPGRRSFVASSLASARPGPVIAATDYMRIVPDQIRPFVEDRRYVSLGTDGFGRSDTRQALRAYFEVDRHHIVVAALKALADDGVIEAGRVAQAIGKYGIDSEAAFAANQ